jgi:arylsulfatase A-like enzyme
MPAQHGVVDTLTADGPFSRTERELSRNIPNLASMLGAGRYEVQYRGKWHLSKGPTGGYDATPEDLAATGSTGGWRPMPAVTQARRTSVVVAPTTTPRTSSRPSRSCTSSRKATLTGRSA